MTDSWRNSCTRSARTLRGDPKLPREGCAHERAGIRHEIIQDGVRESGNDAASVCVNVVPRCSYVLFKPPPLSILYSTHDAFRGCFPPNLRALSPVSPRLSPLCLVLSSLRFSLSSALPPPRLSAFRTWCFRTASADLESNGYAASIPGWKRCLANVSGSNNRAAPVQKYSWGIRVYSGQLFMNLLHPSSKWQARIIEGAGKKHKISLVHFAVIFWKLRKSRPTKKRNKYK